MSWLLDFLKSIANVVLSLLDFVIDSLLMLINLVFRIPDIIEVIFSYIAVLPSSIQFFAMLYIVIIATQYLANRKAE